MDRADLWLDSSLEEEADIAEQSPYLGITSTPVNSSTVSTDGKNTTLISTRPSLQEGFNGPQTQHRLSDKKSLGQLASPSSPTLPRLTRPALVRSQTLPRVSQVENLYKPRRRQAELDQIALAPEATEKIRRWIIGIAIVDFDIDDGPVIDGIYPSSILMPPEAENFPINAEKRPSTQDGFIYGFSHFTQKKDPSLKRGYEQRSVVILTQHEYPAFFSQLISIFGPLFQQHGIPILETACQNITTWRDPVPGETLELGFLGSVIRLALPLSINEQQFILGPSQATKYDPRQHIVASSPPMIPSPLLLFEEAVTQLWSIWECLVLCEPLLIFGASPAQTSQAVWWLRDLMRPIPFAGDFRPYLTMQDGDQSVLVNRLPPKPGILLGVTNPFFEKSCAHWPHILSLGRRSPKTSTAQPPVAGGHAGPAPGWKSKTHKRYISKDRILLKQLESALHGDARQKLLASLALRRHFHSRTTELITPLARYLNTLIPTPTEVAQTSTHNTLRLKPFNNANFFASLKAHGSTLPFRSASKRIDFYERLLKTPGFGLWLAQQEQIVEGVLKGKQIK
ncbi:hypothetical protein C0995_003835 [Termitomyces sp. Mi166|nr:hypothetical protein C0995_003835 [Termitomyces sp. Mi166\